MQESHKNKKGRSDGDPISFGSYIHKGMANEWLYNRRYLNGCQQKIRKIRKK